MNKPEDIKIIVRDKYAEIANQSKTVNEASCCGTGSCTGVDYSVFADDYSKLKGYNPDADLGLGCGLPTEFALINEGDTVIDLGSGAGNDAFVARAIAGEKGKIIGIDFTHEMIDKARANADKLEFNNVEFRFGDIEKMPVTANKADVIISNCVLNLVPDKVKAFKEIYRVLKPGGHFSVSDVVATGDLPDSIKSGAELYAGCVSGAIRKDEYLGIIEDTGFVKIKVQKEKIINIPDEIYGKYISAEELEKFRKSGVNLVSVTVYADKPDEPCCGPDCCN
ncbi:MAG: arsenite methyltransferase [Ignavibacteria bacterium]|jgi:SAM-dependent methyltransferase|nr:arsenite methyltransferase [Ignavibacteria bacterium]